MRSFRICKFRVINRTKFNTKTLQSDWLKCWVDWGPHETRMRPLKLLSNYPSEMGNFYDTHRNCLSVVIKSTSPIHPTLTFHSTTPWEHPRHVSKSSANDMENGNICFAKASRLPDHKHKTLGDELNYPALEQFLPKCNSFFSLRSAVS